MGSQERANLQEIQLAPATPLTHVHGPLPSIKFELFVGLLFGFVVRINLAVSVGPFDLHLRRLWQNGGRVRPERAHLPVPRRLSVHVVRVHRDH